MTFTLHEMSIILRSLFSIDNYMLGLQQEEEILHTDDELVVRLKLIRCYQQSPQLQIHVMNIVKKLTSKNPKKYKSKGGK